MLLQFLKNPKHTGALHSSSHSLSCMMTKNIGIQNAKYIAEIGPGLGVFTQKILNLKQKDARFFAIEINPYFAKKLQEKFKNLEVENKNANQILSIMQNKQIAQLDVVVSGIPWSLLKAKEQDILLKNIHHSLKNGGYFSTFAYILSTPKTILFRKKLQNYFSHIKNSMDVLNNLFLHFAHYCNT